jgi:hypothetical protein
VICCYDDMSGLVSASAAKAGTAYGLVFPRSSWWARMGVRMVNAALWIRGNPFRIFTHRTDTVDSIIRSFGLRRVYQRTSGLWQVAVYARGAAV